MNSMIRVVSIFPLFATLIFSSSEESQIPIYWYVNREEFSNNLIETDFEPETFHIWVNARPLD